MKFIVRNRFIYNTITKQPGEIIDVPPEYIDKLKKANVLGEPVKEVVIETSVLKPVENEMINRSIQKEVKKPIKKGKK